MLLSEKRLEEMNISNSVKHLRRKLFGLSKSEEQSMNRRSFDVIHRRNNRIKAYAMLDRAKLKLEDALATIMAYTDESGLAEYIKTHLIGSSNVENILKHLYTISIYSDAIQTEESEAIKNYCETAKTAFTDAFGNLNDSIARLSDAIIYQFS